MPIYEYQCSNCGHELEELQTMSEPPLVKCPFCGKDTLKRLIGGGSGIIFKGSGFYQTDYKNSSSADKSKSDTSKNDASQNDTLKKTETKPDTKSAAPENKPTKKENKKS